MVRASPRASRRLPILPLPQPTNDIFENWLAELEPAQSARLGALLVHPFARDILAGIAEFSPYLFDLVRADPLRLIRLARMRSGCASGGADRGGERRGARPQSTKPR